MERPIEPESGGEPCSAFERAAEVLRGAAPYAGEQVGELGGHRVALHEEGPGGGGMYVHMDFAAGICGKILASAR